MLTIRFQHDSATCQSVFSSSVMSKAKKRRNELSLIEQRFRIVEDYEGGSVGIRKLAEKYSCGKTQVNRIINSKDKVREDYERGLPQARKRNRTSQYSDLNDAVWEWFKKKHEQNIPIDGPMIQEFATKAADRLGYGTSRRQADG